MIADPPRAMHGSAVSELELTTLAAYARLGDQATVAAELDCGINAVKNRLSTAYSRLGVTNAIEAFTALGWLHVPGTDLIAARALALEADAIEARLRFLLERAAELHMTTPDSDASGSFGSTPSVAGGQRIAATPASSTSWSAA